ncbi:DUF3784 domain-containing protein [Lachnospiraceae bacterium ZAX-1]
MNIGTISCILMASIFALIALIFALLKEKAVILIAGFNMLPKEKQAQYDKGKISVDFRNMCSIWGIIFVAGAVFSFLAGTYMAILAFVVWLVLFFKEVHLTVEKAFEKYKIK